MRDDDKTDLTSWLGLRRLPDFTKAPWLGPALSISGAVIVGGLFVLALASAIKLLSTAVFGSLLDDPRSALGVGGVTVALIGAPFVIWRSVVAQKTVTLQEQGHITDRINTAVQGLGAEKVVDRIGRPIIIWTGKPNTITHRVDDPDNFTLPPRAIETRRYRDTSPLDDTDKNKFYPSVHLEGLHLDVKSWPEDKTMIEWQGTDTSIGETEHLSKVGEWQVFTETQPNLEVRIGAIYALERIAQDSDRDHVQIMEILCAYIRQNAPAPETDDWPELEMRKTEEGGPLESDFNDRRQTFKTALAKAKAKLKPREDIQTALTVIGRRSARQRRLEAGCRVEAPFPFDTPCPDYDGPDDEHDQAALDAYQEKLSAWIKTLREYAGYRLDLRSADLRGATLSGANLSGAWLTGTFLHAAKLGQATLQEANLDGARLQGASLYGARLQGAHLLHARLQGAILRRARLQGAFLHQADLLGADLGLTRTQRASLSLVRLQGANLGRAQLQGANLGRAQLQGASLHGALLQGASLGGARLQGASLYGARLQGASLLEEAWLDEDTDLTAATLRCAAVRSANYTRRPQIAEHLYGMFGDASVTLPGGHVPGDEDWPPHWPTYELGLEEFHCQWHKWQADPENYRPPDPPEPDDTA